MSETIGLCFGGSFNPVHLGHLICARHVAEARGFGRVRLIPSRLNPHKEADASVAGAEHRLAMARLAVADDELFVVDDLEIQRPGPSYTLRTVRALRERFGGPIDWLIGADLLPGLSSWFGYPELLSEITFHVMHRPGYEIEASRLPPEVADLARRNLVEAPAVDISATLIRERIAQGRDVRYLTPDAVSCYIVREGLYQASR
ncbi:MAG: nicotinate (nicotinamide) nucleotide adenylyltransferase [Phycisphaerae bacterium]